MGANVEKFSVESHCCGKPWLSKLQMCISFKSAILLPENYSTYVEYAIQCMDWIIYQNIVYKWKFRNNLNVISGNLHQYLYIDS
jgi:beta-galactosidase/beta-glucuronidase